MTNSIRQYTPAEVDAFKISIIIPTYKEFENLSSLIPYLQSIDNAVVKEIIVADCLSEDGSKELCEKLQARYLACEVASRAIQMNRAAKEATGDILYFVHADTVPPTSFPSDIKEAMKLGYGFGCYPFQFDVDRPLLRFNAWFTKLDKMWCRGGDQSLFIGKEQFLALGGFDEKQSIMEEYEFIKRARKQLSFKILKQARIKVSARKYEENSYLRVNFANFIAINMFKFNMPASRIRSIYKRILNQERT